jgi:hypothetical protein
MYKDEPLELYQKERKEQYLASIRLTESTRKNYVHKLKQLSDYEKLVIQKDISEFSSSDWDKAFKYLMEEERSVVRSPSSLAPYCSSVNGYLVWAKPSFNPQSDVNDVMTVARSSGAWDYAINATIRTIISRYELYSLLIDHRESWQNVVSIILYFEGLNKNEIKNLEVGDCDCINNEISIKGKKMKIAVPSRTMEIIYNVIDEESLKRGASSYATAPLAKTTKVIRVSGKDNIDESKSDTVGDAVVYRRNTKIFEHFDRFKLQLEHIKWSGKIDNLISLEAVYNVDIFKSNDIYKKVTKKYTHSESNWNFLKDLYVEYRSQESGIKEFKSRAIAATTNVEIQNIANNINSILIQTPKAKEETINPSKTPPPPFDDGEIDDNLDNVDTADIDFSVFGLEGKNKIITHLKKERRPHFIKKCKVYFKKHNGELRCEICEMSFSKTYGEIGEDFIEAHHTLPIGELEKATKIEIEDIIMVCSNCIECYTGLIHAAQRNN